MPVLLLKLMWCPVNFLGWNRNEMGSWDYLIRVCVLGRNLRFLSSNFLLRFRKIYFKSIKFLIQWVLLFSWESFEKDKIEEHYWWDQNGLKKYQSFDTVSSFFKEKIPYSGVRSFDTKYGDKMAPISPLTALANAIRLVMMIL